MPDLFCLIFECGNQEHGRAAAIDAKTLKAFRRLQVPGIEGIVQKGLEAMPRQVRMAQFQDEQWKA